jgi:hypothetical protein
MRGSGISMKRGAFWEPNERRKGSTMKRQFLAILVVLTVFALASVAYADGISIQVGGWGPTHFPSPVTPAAGAPWGQNGYPGDTVELQGNTINLSLGTSIQKINTVLWTIDYTYGGTAANPDDWSDVLFGFNAPRDIYSGGKYYGTLGQAGSLKAAWDNDYLSFAAGSTLSFVAQGYKVDITPLATQVWAGKNFDGSNPWTQPNEEIDATFTVSQVPDSSSTLACLGVGLAGIAAFRRKLSV